MSNAPEIARDQEPEKAADTAQVENSQNQQNVSSSSSELTPEKAIANPSSNQNQEIQSNVKEISRPEEALANSTEPPKLDNSARLTDSQSQGTGFSSNVPDMTPEEAKAAADATTITTNPPEHDGTPAQTTTKATADGHKKSVQTESSKKESTASISNNPPENENSTPEQGSTNGVDQVHEKSPQKRDSFAKDAISPRSSKRDSICLPLLGFHMPKEKKTQSKKKKPVRDSAASTSSCKDEHPKSTVDDQKPAESQDIATETSSGQEKHPKSIVDHEKPAVSQGIATVTSSGKEEHLKSTADHQKPAVSQNISTATSSGKDEHPKSTADHQKPAVSQDIPTATSSGKDEHPKSTADHQKPAVSQDIPTATSSGKDEHAKSTTGVQKPAVSQDIAAASSSGKDEHPKSATDSQNPSLFQETATAPGKDEHFKPTADPLKATEVQGSGATSAIDELRKLIDADIKYIKKETNKLDKYKNEVLLQVTEAEQRFDDLSNNNQGTKREFEDLKKAVIKLKLQIPSKHKADAEEKDSHKSHQASKSSRIIADAVKKQMPWLYKSPLFGNCAEVKGFEDVFHGLSLELKLCLLCFAVFPEKAIIKKRLMVYWWIAEGYVPPRNVDVNANTKSAEDFADEYFEKLTKLGFIEPVNIKRSLYVGCYKMHPFVRLALIMMAEKAKFFTFDEEGNPTEDSLDTLQACLMGRGLLDYQDLQNEHASRDLEKLHAVFNVNEAILDFKPEWFLMMKNLNVLYLGRWKMSPTDHIEVEDSNFLNGLSSMEHLKFFSLQGVSRLMELPESISKLSSLIILDLRACHSLESIPEGIRHMKNLTYLDISECYLLEHMPKGVSMLSNLRVLKGFVVGAQQGRNTCTLNDLAKLEKLIKLSIFTGLGEFPTPKHLEALQKIKALKKLTMTWGGSSLHSVSNEHPEPDAAGKSKKETPREERKKEPSTIELKNLEKLDLKSFPKTATPGWLMPSSLKSLKKLYIRGGKFSDLGQYQYLDQKGPNEPAKNRWNVEILRLKFLSEIKMDWRELKDLFPNLMYLEKVNCPKLSFFPSDGYGVWMDKEKLKSRCK